MPEGNHGIVPMKFVVTVPSTLPNRHPSAIIFPGRGWWGVWTGVWHRMRWGGVNSPCGWYPVRGQLPSTGSQDHTHPHTHHADPQIDVQIRILLKDKYVKLCQNKNTGNHTLISWTMFIGFLYLEKQLASQDMFLIRSEKLKFKSEYYLRIYTWNHVRMQTPAITLWFPEQCLLSFFILEKQLASQHMFLIRSELSITAYFYLVL